MPTCDCRCRGHSRLIRFSTTTTSSSCPSIQPRSHPTAQPPVQPLVRLSHEKSGMRFMLRQHVHERRVHGCRRGRRHDRTSRVRYTCAMAQPPPMDTTHPRCHTASPTIEEMRVARGCYWCRRRNRRVSTPSVCTVMGQQTACSGSTDGGTDGGVRITLAT